MQAIGTQSFFYRTEPAKLLFFRPGPQHSSVGRIFTPNSAANANKATFSEIPTGNVGLFNNFNNYYRQLLFSSVD